MRTWVCAALVGLAVAIALVALASSSCGRKDVPGHRADSVLATTPVWGRDTLAQNAEVAGLRNSLAREKARGDKWHAIAKAQEIQGTRQVAAAQAADSTGALVPGLSPHDSIVRLRVSRDLWRGAALHYQKGVVPALHGQIRSDSIWKLTAEAQAATLERQRDFARGRANAITREFQEYRQATKPGTRFLGLELPQWLGDAVRCLPATGVMAGTGAMVNADDRALGAMIGGGATMVGCLVS